MLCFTSFYMYAQLNSTFQLSEKKSRGGFKNQEVERQRLSGNPDNIRL